jgi:hypothetical protein
VLILGLLTVPPVVSALSKILLDDVHYYGWREAWLGVRVFMPVVLLPFSGRSAQRAGLTVFALLELAGLFR